jgi:ribonuclease-3
MYKFVFRLVFCARYPYWSRGVHNRPTMMSENNEKLSAELRAIELIRRLNVGKDYSVDSWRKVFGGERAVSEVQNTLDYEFNDDKNLLEAFTHSSHEGATVWPNNERLEFLGDGVLSLVASEQLFENNEASEGDMTVQRALFVNRAACVNYISNLDLGGFLLVGHSFVSRTSKVSDDMLGDLFEAVIGAVYVDSQYDFKTTRQVVLRMTDKFAAVTESEASYNFKGILHEVLQATHRRETLEYRVLARSGVDHAPKFVCGVYMKDSDALLGVGLSEKNKKKAEQSAARDAMSRLGVHPADPFKRNQREPLSIQARDKESQAVWHQFKSQIRENTYLRILSLFPSPK